LLLALATRPEHLAQRLSAGAVQRSDEEKRGDDGGPAWMHGG
jgi:hypothetical protein